MNEMKAAFAMMLSKLCLFNAFAGCFAGFAYGMLAGVLDREFLGFGSTQITLLGVVCFVVFFASSIGLTMVGNYLVSDAEEDGHVA